MQLTRAITLHFLHSPHPILHQPWPHELDGTRLAIPIAGKRIKTFKKQKDEEPYIEDIKIDNNDDRIIINFDYHIWPKASICKLRQMLYYVSCPPHYHRQSPSPILQSSSDVGDMFN